MKRLFFLAALIVTIGSIGGNILTVHAQTAPAQTLTPAQTAALEQQLAVAKATLVNLEMQAGMVPVGDSGSATVAAQPVATAMPAPAASAGLSASQVSAFNLTLSTLAATLGQLSTSINANTTLTPSQETAVKSTLNGMEGTLVAMANTIETAGAMPVPASAPVAVTRPSGSPVAVNTPAPASAPATMPAPAATTNSAPAMPAPAVAAQTTSPSANNNVPQTAQASSIWSFTKAHWPTIVIILLVIAILAILFWPEKETVKTVSTAGSGKPKSAPITTATMPQSTVSAPAKPMMSNPSPAPATPVANAVAAPSQK